MRLLSFLSLAVASASASAASPHLNVIPYPSDVTLGEGSSLLDAKFTIDIAECTVDCDILRQAVNRYMDIIFQPVGSTGTVFRQTIFEDRINASTPEGKVQPLHQLKVVTTGKKSAPLKLGVEESYFLEVESGDVDQQVSLLILFYSIVIIIIIHIHMDQMTSTLTADTVWGALHGLETFAQLVELQSQSLVIKWTPLRIKDTPR